MMIAGFCLFLRPNLGKYLIWFYLKIILVVHCFSFQAVFDDTIDYSFRNISKLDTNELFAQIKDPSRIKILQLNSNVLLRIPSEIAQFESLVTIEISNNQLSQLPLEIYSLQRLKNLYLKNEK